MRARSYAQIVDPDQPLQEYDTCTCGHCQRVIFVKPGSGATVYLLPRARGGFREAAGAFCRCCMKPVCLSCDAQGTCTPFERVLEQAEARGRFLRSVGLP